VNESGADCVRSGSERGLDGGVEVVVGVEEGDDAGTELLVAFEGRVLDRFRRR
jgi:hypothetical protein